ncbi:hypothetical protein CHS0354_039660 [Potamilus streckersoni]|uniref:Uncharacterized protein n=1 Tax=Potamilus streckersoni TaxID=2493646 RepID=A0AAE0VX37_9BIVA|nr:hypothetical protein CHS0354_039660 [Potamilus streckersoni]
MVVLRTDFIKCVFVGDDAVGKTSMLINYATSRFPTHVPSVFDNYAGSICLGGRHYSLQLIDTLDEGASAEIRRLLYPGADVIAVCFSVIKPNSFLNVEHKWIREVRRIMGDIPVILVGTHADLRDDTLVVQKLHSCSQRPVSVEQAEALCRRLGVACYTECSPAMERVVRKLINAALETAFRPKGGWRGETSGGDSASCTIL